MVCLSVGTHHTTARIDSCCDHLRSERDNYTGRSPKPQQMPSFSLTRDLPMTLARPTLKLGGQPSSMPTVLTPPRPCTIVGLSRSMSSRSGCQGRRRSSSSSSWVVSWPSPVNVGGHGVGGFWSLSIPKQPRVPLSKATTQWRT